MPAWAEPGGTLTGTQHVIRVTKHWRMEGDNHEREFGAEDLADLPDPER